ncbi:hypothetical protein COY93_04845 [Candidatus Uhrbacteria bacterium CG_4_10_14_0_8_um_filter_58_22]|uniref:Uncharacterized protein n=1 Tax=Candidatus Uhrbacteria bacterium CG_4_10_14_0_8_um_filter_58_22 TaxID=1975029 RepID=A0A2M7Q9G5_9BACT|nr:MAG: hypothetical protein AUJ19_04895 [Parcubacteria group bacterium CG1_02_58_44]PIY61724.1 MAG: hypothetical protein COY93_04845 [Candidatus Uhrbacteria bacterium CG_4_10_14_0_8_um_filter_58_22]
MDERQTLHLKLSLILQAVTAAVLLLLTATVIFTYFQSVAARRTCSYQAYLEGQAQSEGFVDGAR